MDASLLLLCLAVGQLSGEGGGYAAPPPVVRPSEFSTNPYAHSRTPSQFVPQSPRMLGEPTPAEPTLAAPASSREAYPAAAASQHASEVVPLHALSQPPGHSEPARDPPLRVAQQAEAHAHVAFLDPHTASPPTAAILLAYALDSQPTSVPGKAISLSTAIDRANDRASLVRAIKAYWQLALSVADHNHATDELGFLAALPSPAAPHERAILDSAVAAARARQAEAELALVAAQQDLAEAAPGVTSVSPLPSDSPFVGVYRTNFSAIFAGKSPPPGLKRIDRTLPVIQRLIDARTTAVNKERAALHSLTDAYERGHILLPHVLDSFLQLRQQQIAFLAAVRDYNYSIADYAVSVFTPDLGREAVISMLIEHPSGDSPSRSILTPRRETQPARETLPSTTPTGERAPSTAHLPTELLPFNTMSKHGTLHTHPAQPAPTQTTPAQTTPVHGAPPTSGFPAPSTPAPSTPAQVPAGQSTAPLYNGAAAIAPHAPSHVADTAPLLTHPSATGGSNSAGSTFSGSSTFVPNSSGTFAPTANSQAAPSATAYPQFKR